jgi:nitrite reductase/ring-hydroxylating ferredoxin subunit
VRVKDSNLRSGDIKAVSDSLCIARHENEVFAFSRYCPHAGADLSLGYLDGNRLRCSWHNLSIDLRSGLSPCKSIARVSVYRVEEIRAGVFEIENDL